MRVGALDQDTAMRLAATEYARFVELLRGLDPADWERPTNCPPWDVRAMATHVLGMAEFVASMREMTRQTVKFVVRARRQHVSPLDAQTGLQVDEHADWSPQRITEAIAAVAPKAVAARRRLSKLMGRVPVPFKQEPGPEVWSFGFLAGTIFTRDVWTHRADIVAATGAPHHLTSDHDGVLIADLVAEWSARHAQPFDLTLTGPAGGHWQVGADGEQLTLDAVEFWRALSGRAPAEGLLRTRAAF
jgi:uncharacterized protein (TIGR03083 family)